MDDRRFDSLVKSLAQGRNRRSVLKGIFGLGGAALMGGALMEDDVDAARRPAPTPTPKPVKCPGKQVPVNGVCTCPGAAPNKCGPDCCTGKSTDSVPGPSTHSECCDNQCCFGSCYGEELCCPTNTTISGGDPTHHICNGPNGTHCCEAAQHCCLIDGCCDTFCYGGSVGASFCCAAANVCAGGGRRDDQCCSDGQRCCGGGTESNICIADVDGACCADADCPNGWVCEDNQCVDSCGGNCGNNASCIQGECLCDPGHYATGEACAPCAAGWYAASYGQQTCDPCDLNSYQDQPGQSACIDCPQDTYTEHVGQIACLDCNCPAGNMPEVCNCPVTCEPGYAPDMFNMCAECPAGTASAGVACLNCAGGTYASEPGSSQCLPCPCGAGCDPATGLCGTVGVGGECSTNSDCDSNVCGCGSPPGLPECMCRFDTCFAAGQDCSAAAGGLGAISCCEGDCTCFNGNTNCICTFPA